MSTFLSRALCPLNAISCTLARVRRLMFALTLIAACAAAPAASAEGSPEELPYDMGQPVPPGYRIEIRTRTGLVAAGAAVAAGAYGAGAYFGYGLRDDPSIYPRHASDIAFVPVIGAFAFATHNPGGLAWAWVASGAAQLGGLVAVVVGLTNKSRVLVRSGAAPESEASARVLVGPGGAALRLAF